MRGASRGETILSEALAATELVLAAIAPSALGRPAAEAAHELGTPMRPFWWSCANSSVRCRMAGRTPTTQLMRDRPTLPLLMATLTTWDQAGAVTACRCVLLEEVAAPQRPFGLEIKPI